MHVLVYVGAHARTQPRDKKRSEPDKEMEVRQPATEAETNGAPGERDRQEILLNQDTA